MGILSNLVGFTRRSALGAGIGAAYGGYEGGIGGMIGGATGGAIGAGFGIMGIKKSLGRIGGVAGIAQRGLGTAAGLTSRAAGRMSGMAGNLSMGGLAANYGVSALGAVGSGLSAAGSFIGRNSAVTNKYGGMALGALGAGAAMHIGSSIMLSNRGY